ncbi:MAG: DEAD/DEAH box helicase [Bacteroidia bacterium]
MKFSEFDLHDEILMGLQDMGFENATPVQEQAIPIILEGNDLIACAQTGTGKTAAFLIPTIDILDDVPGPHIKCLILVPTRELAIQIDKECEGLCYHTYVSCFPVYGGNKGGDDFGRQKAAFTQGADIVIATPGRLLQHIGLGYVDLSKVEFLILDEADRMLDMGFIIDIQRIISYLPENRQNLLFSATMPPKIKEFASEILKNPREISLKVSKPAENITQNAYCVWDEQKVSLVCHLMKEKEIESVIIFASRKTNVDRIAKALKAQGLDVRGMHSDRDQSEREEIINDFKNKKFPVLVATDILSRGIDIDELSHVINYDVPPDPEDYVHRIGRTARADAKGEAITFITEDDMQRFGRIEKLIEREIPKSPLPGGFKEGPVYNPKLRGRGGFGGGGDGRGKGGAGRGRGNDRGRGGKPGGGGQGGSHSGAPRQEGAGQGQVGAKKGKHRHKHGRGDKPLAPADQSRGGQVEAGAAVPTFHAQPVEPHLPAQHQHPGGNPAPTGDAPVKKKKRKKKKVNFRNKDANGANTGGNPGNGNPPTPPQQGE